MSTVIQWARRTLNGRNKRKWKNPEQSTGKLLYQGKDLSWWEATGEARNDYLIRSIREEIQAYSELYIEIFRPTSHVVMFELYMIGKTRDAAEPTFMLIGTDSSYRKALRRVIRESGILDQYSEFRTGDCSSFPWDRDIEGSEGPEPNNDEDINVEPKKNVRGLKVPTMHVSDPLRPASQTIPQDTTIASPVKEHQLKIWRNSFASARAEPIYYQTLQRVRGGNSKLEEEAGRDGIIDEEVDFLISENQSTRLGMTVETNQDIEEQGVSLESWLKEKDIKEEQVQIPTKSTGYQLFSDYLWNSMRLYVLSIASSMEWVLGIGELPENLKRLQWTCHCGHSAYSDYFNTSQFAIDKLLILHQDSRSFKHIEQVFTNYGLVWILWMYCHNFTFDCWWSTILFAKKLQALSISTIISNINSISTPVSPTPNTPDLETSESPATPANSDVSEAGRLHSEHSSRRPTDDIELHNSSESEPDTDERFLLLCIQPPRGVPCLRQPKLLGIDNDRLLFRKLNLEYAQFRTSMMRFLFRVHKISLIQFEIRVNDWVSCIVQDQLPTPPFAQIYEFDPAPHDHPFITKPPLDSTYAVHLFYCPQDCCESRSGQEQNVTFLQIPKRLRNTLRYSSVRNERIGFGVLIQDGLSVGALITVFVVVATLSGLVVGIALISVGFSVGDSFTVAAWPAAIVAIMEAGWLVYITQP